MQKPRMLTRSRRSPPDRVQRRERAEPHVVLEALFRVRLGRIDPGDHEDAVPALEHVAHQAVLRPHVEDVVLVDPPAREKRALALGLGQRLVLDELHQVVLVDHLPGVVARSRPTTQMPPCRWWRCRGGLRRAPGRPAGSLNPSRTLWPSVSMNRWRAAGFRARKLLGDSALRNCRRRTPRSDGPSTPWAESREACRPPLRRRDAHRAGRGLSGPPPRSCRESACRPRRGSRRSRHRPRLSSRRARRLLERSQFHGMLRELGEGLHGRCAGRIGIHDRKLLSRRLREGCRLRAQCQRLGALEQLPELGGLRRDRPCIRSPSACWHHSRTTAASAGISSG